MALWWVSAFLVVTKHSFENRYAIYRIVAGVFQMHADE